MADNSFEPILAIAGVWISEFTDSNPKGEDKANGTAFFISPTLLVTAKHVLQDKNGDWHKGLHLTQVPGQYRVDFKKIHYHETLDIALIELDHFFNNNFFKIDFSKRDYTDDKYHVNIYAFDCDAKAFASEDNYKVNKLDQEFGQFTIPTSVKKGYSGCAVTLNTDIENIIGIIVARNKQHEPESFILPLYLCKEWLQNLNQKINDEHLASYLAPKIVNYIQTDQINNKIKLLAKFIGRPESAYLHVVKEFQQNRIVKACLCLHSSNENVPMDFAITLRARINNVSLEKIDLAQLEKLNLDDCYVLGADCWAFDENNQENFSSKEKFIYECISGISKELKIPEVNISEPGYQGRLYDEILNALKHITEPKILISEARISEKKSFFKFMKNRKIQKIKERFEWIQEINKEFELRAAKQPKGQTFMPLVLLFFIQVDKSLLSKANCHCFSLADISETSFDKWRTPIVNYFKADLYNRLETIKQKITPSLTYKQFLEHIESAFSTGKS